jgi:hypothetical protein
MDLMRTLSLLFSLLFSTLTFSQNQADSKMKKILKEISLKAIELGDHHSYFSQEQKDSVWIGYKPSTKQEIEQLEKRLGVSLPKDFVEFLLITNGFHSATGVDPGFGTTHQIDWLKNADPELFEIWIQTGNDEVGNKLKTAIKVGGFGEEQHFFLIPPSTENPKWEYWEFSAWAPGETVHHSMLEYFRSVLETTKRFLENKR